MSDTMRQKLLLALATIQALYHLLQAQQTQLAAQHARISALETQLAAMTPALPGETQFGGNAWRSENGNTELAMPGWRHDP